MDKIFIRDLTLEMSIGLYAHEKTAKQRVIINIALFVAPPREGWRSEAIEDTVSYEDITNKITRLCAQKHFELVETLAEEIASDCLTNPHVKSVCVSVEKPDIIKNTRSVGIEITRDKPKNDNFRGIT